MLHDPEGAAIVDLILQMADAGFEALCDALVVFLGGHLVSRPSR